MHLYLIRHGESHVNLPEWEGGFLDAGLTDLGQRQARALATWLPTHLPTIDALYTSTMRRALETTAYLIRAYNQAAQKDDRLREIGNNRLDHIPWPSDDLPTKYADYWATERPFSPVTLKEQGESLMHFRFRVGSFIEEVAEQRRGQIVVAVCHGGVFDATFDHVFNIGPWRRCEIWVRNTGITYFEYVEHSVRETWRLHYHDQTEHLRGMEV